LSDLLAYLNSIEYVESFHLDHAESNGHNSVVTDSNL